MNKLEEVEAGIEHSPDEVWTEYRDPGRGPWETLVLPVLKQMPIDRLVVATGMHRRRLFAIRAGERRPHRRNQQALIAAAGAFARGRLGDLRIELPADGLVVCAVYLTDMALSS